MAFTSQITGSPFTTPQANITAMAYVNHGGSPAVKRIYYASANDFTKIFCMSVTGTADTSREINIQNQGDARTSTCRGLCTDGTNLYALTGDLGNQYVHAYKLSDRTFIAAYQLGYSANHYARGIETFVKPGATERRINILLDNVIRSYTVTLTSNSISLSQQTDGSFAMPTNVMVNSGAWQSLAWDDTVDRLLVVAEQQIPTPGFPGNFTDQDKVFGFVYNGARDDREDFLPGIDGDAMTYNSDDDDLYIVHESSTRLYVWQDAPRWNLPDNFDFNFTEGVTRSIDLKPLVDTGATITARNAYTTRTGLQNAALSNGDFTWTTPPAPSGGRTSQTINLTFRATLGANHTDHTFPFVLNAASPVVINPMFAASGIPQQVVYEPYIPPIGAPSPNLAHGFAINLSDFVASGTGPFTFSVNRNQTPGTAQLTTRFVNQQAIHDRLVYNADAVSSSVNSTITVGVRHTGASTDSDTTDIPVEIINLVYPSWHGRQNISLTNTSLQTVNLRDLSSGEPQTSLDIVGDVPPVLTASIVDGELQVAAHSLPENASTEMITVKQTNILTTTDGVQRTFNINLAARPVVVTRVAPEWTPHDINIRTNRGVRNRLELNQYITQGNPEPTFSVSAPSGVLDTIEGSISGQHFFQYTIPDSITTDQTYTVDITATNDLDASVKTITITGVAITVPVLGPYPHQQVQQGEVLRIDIDDYVIGQRPITYAPQGNIRGVTGASLNGSILTYDTSHIMLRNENYDQSIPFTMSNALTTTPVGASIHVLITVTVKPIWQQGPIRLEMLEGDTKSFPLGGYVSGHPTPVIDFASGFVGGVLDETIQNNTLTVRNAPVNHADTHYEIDLTATSDGQSTNKTIELEVLSQDQFNNTNTFTVTDFNQIRYLLGPPITKVDMPDTIIQSYVYEEASKEWAERIIPNDVDNPLSIVDLKGKKRAVLYRCAALLCGRALSIVEQQVGQIDQTFGEIDWHARERSLNQKADYEITRILRSRGNQASYNFFRLTGG